MTTTSMPAMPAPEVQAPVSHFGRIIGVFTSPKQTFAGIAQRPSWVAPLLLCVILATGVGALLNTKMNWGEYIRHKAEESPRFSQLSEEQKDQALAGQVKFWSSFSYGVGVVAVPISALIFALTYWGSFNLFRGAGLRFGTSFAITTHAFLPTALSSVLAMIILPLKSYGDVDPESVVATSLKAYLPDSAPKPLLALGSSLELFWIWCLVLLAIGFAAANPKKIKPGTSFGIVFGLWAVWVLAKVAWAAL
jgi:Yip1 domain